MNKFAAIVLFAMIAVAASATEQREHSQEEIQKETGLLSGKEKLFINYCLESRDAIVEDMSKRPRETSSPIFDAFFGSTSEISDEASNVDRKAIEQLYNNIQHPTDVSDGPTPEDQIQALIEDGKRKIESTGTLGSKMAASALVNAADRSLFVRLGVVRALTNAGLMTKGFLNTCKQIDNYQKELEARLVLAKESLKSENTELELQSFIDSVTVPTLKCYTTKFVSRLNGFCGLFNAATSPFYKMLGGQAIEDQRA